MRLYHSSSVVVERPDMRHSRDYLDFGRGFYLTPILEQARKYGERFLRRGQNARLNVYEMADEPGEWKILRFDSYDSAWLDFVAACRAGNDDSDYDLVIGGVADDRVIQTLDRYFAGEISQEIALGLLKFEKPNLQYCIRSERFLQKRLTYVGSERL